MSTMNTMDDYGALFLLAHTNGLTTKTCGSRKPTATVNRPMNARVITPLAAHNDRMLRSSPQPLQSWECMGTSLETELPIIALPLQHTESH
jgi:hypothetical protein